MDPEKQKAIQNAAIREFAEKGFDQASTNKIAENAGVSKGLIFHYYSSKEKLFESCVLKATDFTMSELDYAHLDLAGDPIEKLREFCIREFEFCRNHPTIYKLLGGAMLRPPAACSKEMKKLFNQFQTMVPELFQKMIDSLDLKEDVDQKILLDVLISHYSYYFVQASSYFTAHPDAAIDSATPFVNQFLAMLAMSLRGLMKSG